jgi:mannose-1-phosphate guanylyltransferase/mannose-6-phosphate isomerase
MKITPVILCGGAGTRIWPLSRKSFPKQFVPLIDNKSLLQLTLERVLALNTYIQSSIDTDKIICVASEEHRFLVSNAIESACSSIGNSTHLLKKTVLLEPFGKNTAPAMTLAALLIESRKDPNELFLFCPADHHIPDANSFCESIQEGIIAAQLGAIVTFGILPTFPSTAYGYIEQGVQREDGSWRVNRFIEKPNSENANNLLLKGGVFWNAGIFLMSASTFMQALKLHSPDILISCEVAMASAKVESGAPSQSGREQLTAPVFIRPEIEAFRTCRSESFDYAVLEHCAEVAVVPFKGQWSDVGSWNAVAAMTSPDVDGNRVEGSGIALKSKNTFLHAPHRMVVALGTDNLLIVDTPDALLVVHSDYAEGVKDVVNRLEKDQLTEAVTHRKVSRPWGWYDRVDMGERFQVKRICVKPGASLSLQMHHHRAEHWIVVAGTAEVTCGTNTFLLSENQSTFIPIGEVHRLKNPGKVALEMIEVQSGSYLSEDDIVRIEDNYGRVLQNRD